VKMSNTPTVGSVAANPHEGSRSEILADYLFSGWGTVTPVRRQDDHGIDLYCTLTERRGQRAIVRDYFVVQVKSKIEPWVLEGDSVRWLVEYPSPLFLAYVDKKALILSIYHVTPRFIVGIGPMPVRLELVPEETDDGTFVAWENGERFSLSAPILRVTLGDLINGATLESIREVFKHWIKMERDNCDLLRRGLLRFRVPYEYTVNQMPSSMIEGGNARPGPDLLKRCIVSTAESIECLGGQLAYLGDREGALYAALLLDHLQKKRPEAFEGEASWRNRVPGTLGQHVCNGLNKAMAETPEYRYAGLEAVENMIKKDELVSRYLKIT
jgi:hypothetical protein